VDYKANNRVRYERRSGVKKYETSWWGKTSSIDIAHWVIDHLRTLEGGSLKILSIGAGVGFKEQVIHDALPHTSIVAIDIAFRPLTERAIHFGSGLNVQGDMESLAFGENSFDAVCFFGALHHSQYPLKVLNEVRRVLRPDGIVLLAEPASIIMWLTGQGFDAVGDGVNFRFSVPYLCGQVRLAGLHIDALSTRTLSSRVAVPVLGPRNWVFQMCTVLDGVLLRLPGCSRLGALSFIAARKPGDPVPEGSR
jgi:SAM-dependent methyltransferase